MARVTVEDCVEKVPNRFELVMVASQRSREISAGGEIRVERDNDKNPVVALREIADEKPFRPICTNLLFKACRNTLKSMNQKKTALTPWRPTPSLPRLPAKWASRWWRAPDRWPMIWTTRKKKWHRAPRAPMPM